MSHISALTMLLLAVLVGGCSGDSGVSTNPDDSARGDGTPGREVATFGSDLSFEDVKAKLQLSDSQQMAEGVVQMVTMEHRGEVARLLQDVWAGARDVHPELNWQVIETPQVRVALAQVLGQWHPDDPQYRDYILTALQRAQGLDKVDALIALGAVATESDIEFLERTAREADETTAAGALSALQVSGGRSAVEALERIKNDATLSSGKRKLATQLLGLPRPPRE